MFATQGAPLVSVKGTSSKLVAGVIYIGSKFTTGVNDIRSYIFPQAFIDYSYIGAKLVAGVNKCCSKFTTGVNSAGSKFAADNTIRLPEISIVKKSIYKCNCYPIVAPQNTKINHSFTHFLYLPPVSLILMVRISKWFT